MIAKEIYRLWIVGAREHRINPIYPEGSKQLNRILVEAHHVYLPYFRLRALGKD
jgi:hypothetical protein